MKRGKPTKKPTNWRKFLTTEEKDQIAYIKDLQALALRRARKWMKAKDKIINRAIARARRAK